MPRAKGAAHRRDRRAVRGAIPALAACVAFGLAGCATNKVELWPLFYYEKDPASVEPVKGAEANTHVLGPIISVQNSPERHYHAVRPLWNYEEKRDGSFEQAQFIWPLGLYRKDGDMEKLVRFIPIFHHGGKRSTVTGDWETQGFVFPLAYWGRVRKGEKHGGRYFALFPIGGVIRQLFVDRFRFVLFPIWSQTNAGEYSRHDVLWPIVSWGGTPDGKRRVLRVWPFYVHKHKRGFWEQNWVLWPFVLWGKEDLNSRYPKRYWGFFPFYVSKYSEDKDRNTVAYDRRVLYFLFVRRKDRRTKHELSSWAILWPLTNFEDGVKRNETRIWPIYWRTDYKGKGKEPYAMRRYRVLWPIIWVTRDKRKDDVTARDILVVPFYWDYAKKYADKTRSRSITVFPLYTFARDKDGSVHHWVVSHGWKDVTQGWKRNLRALIDLFQWHRWADGRRHLRILWRLVEYHRDKREDMRRFELNPFFTVERHKQYGRWSCVFGIIAREKRGERRRWRIFYIPFGDKIERPER
jgi:hypothetical protein